MEEVKPSATKPQNEFIDEQIFIQTTYLFLERTASSAKKGPYMRRRAEVRSANMVIK